MDLLFSRNNPLDTTILDARSKHLIYNVCTSQPRRKVFGGERLCTEVVRCRSLDVIAGRFEQADDKQTPQSPADPVLGLVQPLQVQAGQAIHPESIASIEWHRYSSNFICFNGIRVPEEQFLAGPRFSYSRSFNSSGDLFVWRDDNGHLILTPSHSDIVLARFLRPTIGSSKNNESLQNLARLEITPDGLELMDLIIVTLLVIQKNMKGDEEIDGGENIEITDMS